MPDPALPATRDYVAAEANTRTVEGLIELVESETRRFQAAARTAAGGSATDGGWSALDVTRHLVSRSMLRAREVLWVALSGELPTPEETMLPDDVEGLLRVHREAMDSLYEHVRAAPEDFAGITWEHPAVGAMDWREWLVFIALHIADHANQLEAMAPSR